MVATNVCYSFRDGDSILTYRLPCFCTNNTLLPSVTTDICYPFRNGDSNMTHRTPCLTQITLHDIHGLTLAGLMDEWERTDVLQNNPVPGFSRYDKQHIYMTSPLISHSLPDVSTCDTEREIWWILQTGP